jgi:hypothetical protein
MFLSQKLTEEMVTPGKGVGAWDWRSAALLPIPAFSMEGE